MQSHKKAVLNMLLFSFISPLVLVAVTLVPYLYFLPVPGVCIAAGYLYYYLIFHKNPSELQGFRVLLAFISTFIQILILIVSFKVYFYFFPLDTKNGHLNGNAVLMFLLINAVPLLYNTVPMIVWLIKKINKHKS